MVSFFWVFHCFYDAEISRVFSVSVSFYDTNMSGYIFSLLLRRHFVLCFSGAHIFLLTDEIMTFSLDIEMEKQSR